MNFAQELNRIKSCRPDGFELGAIMNPDAAFNSKCEDFWHVRTKFKPEVPKADAQRYLNWCQSALRNYEQTLERLSILQSIIRGNIRDGEVCSGNLMLASKKIVELLELK